MVIQRRLTQRAADFEAPSAGTGIDDEVHGYSSLSGGMAAAFWGGGCSVFRLVLGAARSITRFLAQKFA